ncbi:hypothetical protein DXG01_005102 [Tephrocybe rancida]|nr:hypothetical protein DXG01_005102 [Tephrocybe rancida]
MSTRARTRAATAASMSKTTPAAPVKTQPKPKNQTRKAAQVPPVSQQPEEKENVKAKSVKTPAKTPSKVATSATHRRSTRSTPVVFCHCKRGDDGTPMVQCGECRTWYHFSCIELKEEEAEDIMTWEGEEALEKHTAKPAPPAKEPVVKKVKRDSPVEPPASESESDGSSEDEYVAEEAAKVKGKSAVKRQAYVSESDSEASDDAKPRRHRIKKSTGSPPPSTLKRKSQHASHTPPPKRKKSDALAPTDDPARKYCVSQLETLFRDVFLRYPRVRVENEDGETSIVQKPLDELSEEEKTALLDESKQFADELERCVFDIYSEQDKSGQPSAGSNYKDRFRMLKFNLSKFDRVVIHQRIVSAEITPKEISLMSSTDLANEETKQSIKIAEKEALAYSILKPTTAPRAKITHKGLEDIEDVHGEMSSVQDEERSRREEEERRDIERLARLKAQSQPRQRTASVSVPPESPVDPVAQPQEPWGGPPPVPLHALLPNIAMPSSPTVFSNEASPMTPVFSHPFSDPSEPELNLADFINIDEEGAPSATTAPAPSSPSPTQIITDEPSSSQASPPEPSPISPTGISPFAQKSEPSRSMSFDLNALWSAPKTESPTSPTAAEKPVASTSSPQATSDDKDVVMDVEGGGADDYDFDMFLEEKDSVDNSVEAQQAALDALPQVWTGKINMPLDSTIPQEISVNARQVGGRPLEHDSVLWKTLFPTELLRIDGRVPVENSGKFLLQMRMNSSKELIAVAFSPSSESADVGFHILSDFLIAKGRHGLVFPWGSKPQDHHPGRELYIIPLLSSDPLPEYMELLDDLHLPKTRKANILIGIWILNKGKLAPPPAPPAPAIPTFAAMPPTLPAAPTPQLPHVPPAPLLPANIAAEVASLTPAQIQLMIQTLTANGAMALPALPPPQNPPRVRQLPPRGHAPPPPPHMMPPQQHPQVYPPHSTQSWGNSGHSYSGPAIFHQPPPPPNPPMQRPGPLSWDRPGDNHPVVYERDDRGGRGWRGGRGSSPASRGRGRGNDIPQQPLDSGWPRKPRNDGAPGPSSPPRRW